MADVEGDGVTAAQLPAASESSSAEDMRGEAQDMGEDGVELSQLERLRLQFAAICKWSPVHQRMTGERADRCSVKRASRSPIGDLVLGPRPYRKKGLPPLRVPDIPSVRPRGANFWLA